DAKKRDFLNGLTEELQGLHARGMISKMEGNAARLPTERLHGFDRHQPMGHLTDNVGGTDANDLLVFDSLEKLGGRRSKLHVGFEMVDEHAGIDEGRRASGQIGIDHAVSSGSSSGLNATKSASSWLPVQPMRPAVCRTRLVTGLTVIWTLACSSRGSG